MKRQGFSLTEIIITVFAIAVVAAVLFPLKIIDLHQAERIAVWKSFYPELQYSFDIFQQKEKPFIQQYEQNNSLKPYIFFDEFTKYLKLDNLNKPQINYQQYHHFFLNGKIVKSISKYRADKFVRLSNGMIIGFAGSANIPAEMPLKKPLGVLFIDINGRTKRNTIGRDVFLVYVYPDGLAPVGADEPIQNLKEDCSPVGSGIKCGAYYLVGSSF